MRNKKTIEMVYLALFLTIILVMSQVPWLGFIPLGFTTATIIHIPVIIAAIYFGKKMGTLTGLFFGLSSFATAYIRPTGVFDLFFQNPIVSVLPRIAFAFLTVYFYQLLKGIDNSKIRVTLTALISSFAHSILTIGTLVLVYFNKTKSFINADGETETMTITLSLIGVALLISVIAEAVVSALITTPVIHALFSNHETGEHLYVEEEE
jgi:uncharacterized membrane protein